MKLYFLYITLIPLNWFSFKDSPSDFEYKLSNIANNFEENIMDKDKCEDLKNEVSSIADEIDDEIEDKDEHSSTEIVEFKKMKKKAEALKDYIGVVAGISTTFPTIDEFNSANSMVGGIVVNVSKDKFCIDIISVSIGKYIVFLAKNSTTINYHLDYSWKFEGMGIGGYGDFGIIKKSYCHIYNNRENPSLKTDRLTTSNCKTF
jgi:hypothetical protein